MAIAGSCMPDCTDVDWRMDARSLVLGMENWLQAMPIATHLPRRWYTYDTPGGAMSNVSCGKQSTEFGIKRQLTGSANVHFNHCISFYASILPAWRLIAVIPTDRSFKSQLGNQSNSALSGMFLRYTKTIFPCN